jgi:coenzyme F420-0:L-glutamate ligase / coenzyme F420-1:gamma-L-glutamate ligase
MKLEIIGIKSIPIIKKDDEVAELILESMEKEVLKVHDGDIFVIAETAIAKSEGNMIEISNITPSLKSSKIADKTGKDARLVEAIIQESNEIIKVGPDFIVSETKHGFVCANAGIDESNVDKGLATPIPEDPDRSAADIRTKMVKKTGKEVGIIISDTQGRAFREGAIGVAIGISGMKPLWDRSGEHDLYGKELKTTSIAVADELASAASIVMGQADEGIPVVIIRGVEYFEKLKDNFETIKPLIRPKKYDVFR